MPRALNELGKHWLPQPISMTKTVLSLRGEVPIFRISIVIPALNEAPFIRQTLLALQSLRQSGHEVIVVDGTSHDGTETIAQAFSDHVIRSHRGRARQLNSGARIANGEILLFLHADTTLPPFADRLIIDGMKNTNRHWGRFNVRLSGKQPLLRIVESLMNWRSRLTGIATGDQGIFVLRDLFKRIGGFPEIDLMEDIALSKLLKKNCRPLCLSQRVITSSRRWERNGVVRTILLMWHLRLVYALGANPRRLAQLYETLK
jgi:rSAM/selenodomain-associated transferase 2